MIQQKQEGIHSIIIDIGNTQWCYYFNQESKLYTNLKGCSVSERISEYLALQLMF